ncbi:hypothetical protein BC936DRAFT_148084 [Jimgerdemannia flammicorona]|uniref:Transmembrane protein n=1 Tax=Jimgerdemannia flammicorona TaxID=994334 RepID=A0A433D3T5_9FUNG|nr:hypothetical protein BC936DRAFT_148084 [Jimgerdemannia flammicorona]
MISTSKPVIHALGDNRFTEGARRVITSGAYCVAHICVLKILLGATIRRQLFGVWEQSITKEKLEGEDVHETSTTVSAATTTSSATHPENGNMRRRDRASEWSSLVTQAITTTTTSPAQPPQSLPDDELICFLAGTGADPPIPTWPYFILIIRLWLLYLVFRDAQFLRYLGWQAIRLLCLYTAYHVISLLRKHVTMVAVIGSWVVVGWNSIRAQMKMVVRANLENLITTVLVLLTLVVGFVGVWFLAIKVVDEVLSCIDIITSAFSSLSTVTLPKVSASLPVDIRVNQSWAIYMSILEEYRPLWVQLFDRENPKIAIPTIQSDIPVVNLSRSSLADLLAILPTTHAILVKTDSQNYTRVLSNATLMNTPISELMSRAGTQTATWVMEIVPVATLTSLLGSTLTVLGGTLLTFLDLIWQLILFVSTLQFFLSRPLPINHIISRLLVLVDPTHRFGQALHNAILGTFSATLQLVLLHGFWTWLTFSLADVAFVYLHVLASVFIAVLPVASPVVVIIPAVLGLAFAQGRALTALSLTAAHVAFAAIIDPLAYSVIPRAHPFFIALGILMGKWVFGWPGLVVAPVVMTCVEYPDIS